jgi:hypothetical protein
MKRLLAILLAALLCVSVFAGCGKKDGGGKDDGGKTTQAAAEIPADLKQYSALNGYYGLKLDLALPTFEEAEEKDNTTELDSTRMLYTLYTNKAEYNCARVRVYIGLCDQYSVDSEFTRTDHPATEIQLGGDRASKVDMTDTSSSGKEVEYTIFKTWLDGYARASINVEYLNDDLNDEQWNSILDAVEKYTVFSALDENGLTRDGKLVDNSGKLAFATPATIAGQSVELKHYVRGISLGIRGEYEVDGITHRIMDFGDTTETVFEARKKDTEKYKKIKSGDYTIYGYIINRFPDAEFDAYVEIDGVYYNFYIVRKNKLDVDGNKAFCADEKTYQLFADMVADMIGNAEIDSGV